MRRRKRQVVGFFKENDKTKPVTKSTAGLKRKKVVKKPRVFKGIKPRRLSPNQIRTMVDHFYAVLTKPVQEASSWYTLYYLSEFAKLPESEKEILRFEFLKKSEQLDKAFFNYGTYAVLRELRHVDNQIALPFGEWIGKFRDEAEGDKQKFLNALIPRSMTREEAELVWLVGKADIESKRRGDIISFMLRLRKKGVDLRDRQELFKTAEGIFKNFRWNHKYEAKMQGKVATHWRNHKLDKIICDLLLNLNPSSVFGFFAGNEHWSDGGAKYRYFFTNGLNQAFKNGLNKSLSGCFYNVSGRGSTAILGALGRTFRDFVESAYNKEFVLNIARHGRIEGNIEIGINALTGKNVGSI